MLDSRWNEVLGQSKRRPSWQFIRTTVVKAANASAPRCVLEHAKLYGDTTLIAKERCGERTPAARGSAKAVAC